MQYIDLYSLSREYIFFNSYVRIIRFTLETEKIIC